MPINTEDFHHWLINIRRDFHRHPELSHQETRTTDRIIDILDKLGIDTQRFDDMTGAVGLITGASEGKTIALIIQPPKTSTSELTAKAILRCRSFSSSAAWASSFRTRSMLAFVRTCQLSNKCTYNHQ